MPNYYKNNKNKSRRLNLSYGEFTNRWAARPTPPNPALGSVLHNSRASPHREDLSSADVCGRNISQFMQHWMIIVAKLFRLMLLLWAVTPPLIHVSHFFIISVALPASSHLLSPLSHSSFSLPLSALLWENFLLSMNSTVTTPQPALTPIITSTVTLAPGGFPVTRC